MSAYRAITVLTLAFSLIAIHIPAQEIIYDIDKVVTYEGNTVGMVQSLRIAAGRLTVDAVLFPELFTVLDSTMGRRGDLEQDHWSRRIYWIGNTRVLSAVGQEADHLRLSTAIRYEQWTRVDLLFDTLKTRLFRVTKTVDWKFWIPEAVLSNIALYAKVINIRDFPDWLENELDLRLTESFGLTLPVGCGSCNCEEFANRAGVKFAGATFIRTEDSRVAVQFAFDFTGSIKISECWSL